MISQGHQGRGLIVTAQPDLAQRFSDLVSQEMLRVPRGEPLPLFKDFVAPYLVTNAPINQFLQILHAELALPQRSTVLKPLTEKQFTEFLRHEAPVLQDKYLGYKSKGFTGCYDVSTDATARLNRAVAGCAEEILTARGEHQYTGVAIGNRYFVLDFTVDQFLAYPEIVRISRSGLQQERQRDASSPSYAGFLMLPSYRIPV